MIRNRTLIRIITASTLASLLTFAGCSSDNATGTDPEQNIDYGTESGMPSAPVPHNGTPASASAQL